ncbi:MAG: acyloxyacyl hydrolase [Geobacteraceae bacterium]|nr:acyloxyacyl hydrolase [Geobacteraceae bacterium]
MASTAPCIAPVHAFDLSTPQHVGVGVTPGASYDPSPTFAFALLHGMAVYDYEDIMGHPAPEALRFKFEGNIGLSDHSQPRLLASANIFAQYYLRGLAYGALHPYIEGGVGLIYTDFQVKDQGLRLNFNPQAGIGAEWHTAHGTRWYTALRAWHVSNGGLHHDNRGINAVTLQCGRIF